MFTGLVREIGTVERVHRHASVTRVLLAARRTSQNVAVGSSLAVNGICLTAIRVTGRHVLVEATAETRRVTTLMRWRPGDQVHVEPPLRVGDSLDGHFVLGHVDGVGRVSKIVRHGNSAVLVIELDRRLADRLVPKGSIAVDGVSLTLDDGPFSSSCSVTLIPHTLAATRFGRVPVGELVNLELDVLAKAAANRRGTTTAGAPDTPGNVAPTATPLTLASIRARGWRQTESG